jgi:hypothetical protein
MISSAVFGIKAPSLDDACALVEDALDVTMNPHHSLHLGGDYFRFEQGELCLILRPNIDLLDDEPAELKFPRIPFILYVDGMTDDRIIAKLQSALGLFVELRRKHYPDLPSPAHQKR